MANNQINKLLEFANMQMAAEAFLIRPGESSVPTDAAELLQRLELGNTHASAFTPVQATAFTNSTTGYEVVTQYRNDPLQANGSGFSGTLFKNLQTGELTLSLRSTEFRDDEVRDSKATNELEIKDLGWALGQIAEMEAWYNDLRGNTAYLADGNGGVKNFNVTGYSLGGHLATAFNILRREEAQSTGTANPIIATYTFNGAGTGGLLNDRRLTDLLTDFNSIRANYTTSAKWLALSSEEQPLLQAQAQSRVDAINTERNRVAGLSRLSVVRPGRWAAQHLLFSVVFLLSLGSVWAGITPLAIRDTRDFEIKDSNYRTLNPAGMQVEYWLDNENLLFVGYKMPANPQDKKSNERPELRLRLWNLKTNRISTHLEADIAFGSLCVRDGYVAFRYALHEDESKQSGRRFIFEGLFGQEKKSLDDALKDQVERRRVDKSVEPGRDFVEFNNLTCRYYRRSELPNLGKYVRPLLLGDYIAREYVEDDEQAHHNLPGTYWYYSRGGKKIPLRFFEKDAGIGRYFSYRDSYVLGQISQHVILSEKVLRKYGLMNRKGDIQDFTPPSGPWMNSIVSIGPTRLGLFLTSNAINTGGGNGSAGAYLVIDGEMKRLVAGLPGAFDISPNGCRVALPIADRGEGAGSSYRLKVITIC